MDDSDAVTSSFSLDDPWRSEAYLTLTPILRRRLTGAFSLFLIGIALMLGAVTRAHAVSIELKGVAPDRIERQKQAATGRLPLSGTPNISRRDARLKVKDLAAGAPVFIRIFKEESELEVWMRRGSVFVHFATYPICNWSGGLGPKLQEGDKQAPEGFYTVTRRRLRRSGRWPQSLNLGFPNVLDSSMARTGSYILVHGGCTSVGCFAMTNPVIDEIFELTKAAIEGGQTHVPVHVLPFRMSEKNLARHKGSKWFDFWKNLKEGYDSFERTHLPPHINVCKSRYEIRDGALSEVGVKRPLGVCGETAALVKIYKLLLSDARHPSQWTKLSALESKVLEKLMARGTLEKVRLKLARASRRQGGRARRGRFVTCKLTLASCRRHMALKRKRYQARSRLSSKARKRSGKRRRLARRRK